MFSSKRVEIDKIQQLNRKSESAIAVFKSTLNSLNDINGEIDDEISFREVKIELIQGEINSLKAREASNSVFVKKLMEFFEE